VDFLILATDKPGRESVRDELRSKRIQWLRANKHRLVAAGGKVDDTNHHVHGGLMIIEAKDRAEAEAFAQQDPFAPAGLYESVEVVRWRRVFFNHEQLVSPDPFAPDPQS
jgi:uncharacterized protein YciI